MPEQKPDDLAAELVSDPANLPDLVVMRGYLGKSSRASFSRLYVDTSFSEFVELADKDILARRSLASDQDPLGVTLLWVSRSTTYLRTTVCSAEEHASFLKGNIAVSASSGSRMELPAARRGGALGVVNWGPTDPLFYSTCRGPNCVDPLPPHHCCLGPATTLM